MPPILQRLQTIRSRSRRRSRGRGGRLPLAAHVALMVAATATVLSGLLWLLTSDRTSPLSATPDDQTTLETIRLAFYAVAGIGGVIALTVAYRKQRLNEAESEREEARLFNERFAAAAEQLSAEQAANRLAGVYAMAALADEWDEGRQTCVNVLCAYIRMPYEAPPRRKEREAAGLEAFRPVLEERLVRNTVLSVIAERLRAEPIDGQTWHECDFDFTGATIDEADFSKAVFKGRAVFEYVRFPRGTADFSEARFMGPVSFRRSHFSGGRLFFERAECSNTFDFTQATVSAGALNFLYASFQGAVTSFADSILEGGDVRFGSCEFAAKGQVRFYRVAFSGAEVAFVGTRPEDVTLDFTGAADWTHPPKFDAPSEALAQGLRTADPIEVPSPSEA